MLQHLWKSALLSGILAVILGILALTWPGITIVVAAIFFGAYLLVTGFSQVLFAFSLHVSAGGRVMMFISGAACRTSQLFWKSRGTTKATSRFLVWIRRSIAVSWSIPSVSVRRSKAPQ